MFVFLFRFFSANSAKSKEQKKKFIMFLLPFAFFCLKNRPHVPLCLTIEVFTCVYVERIQ